MTNEQHEISYAGNGILRGIHDLPEAAEIALDELRRDPLNAEDPSFITELKQNYGSEVSSFYSFYSRVINDTKTFIAIDFDPVVDEIVATDSSQDRVIEELYAKYQANYNPDDIAPEKVVALSNRANLLRAVATLAIKVRIETKPAKRSNKAEQARTVNSGRRVALPN